MANELPQGEGEGVWDEEGKWVGKGRRELQGSACEGELEGRDSIQTQRSARTIDRSADYRILPAAVVAAAAPDVNLPAAAVPSIAVLSRHHHYNHQQHWQPQQQQQQQQLGHAAVRASDDGAWPAGERHCCRQMMNVLNLLLLLQLPQRRRHYRLC